MEKFALLNLLKAIETLSSGEKQADNTAAPPTAPTSTAPSAPPKPEEAPAYIPQNNVMSNVLSRHEEIANRIRNKHN